MLRGGDVLLLWRRLRQVFTKEEFTERFKSIWYPGQPVRYYVEPGSDGSHRLAFLKLDKDGAGRWDRLIDTCLRFLRQRSDIRIASPERRPQVEAFANLVRRNQFQITVLTALKEKKRAIELELARREGAREPIPPLQVHVVPGLFEILCPMVRAPGKK